MIEMALVIEDLHFTYSEMMSRRKIRSQGFLNWRGLLGAVLEDSKKEVLSGVNLKVKVRRDDLYWWCFRAGEKCLFKNYCRPC